MGRTGRKSRRNVHITGAACLGSAAALIGLIMIIRIVRLQKMNQLNKTEEPK